MLNRVFNMKLWLLATMVLATSAISIASTYAVLQFKAVPPTECAACPPCSVTPEKPVKSDRWNYKPLPYRGGKSY